MTGNTVHYASHP